MPKDLRVLQDEARIEQDYATHVESEGMDPETREMLSDLLEERTVVVNEPQARRLLKALANQSRARRA